MAENLTCSVCGNAATVHLTQIVNNKIHKVDLCEACAQKKGVTDPEGFSLADLLAKGSLTPGNADEAERKCEACGYETADFRRTGRLGCAECYSVFRPVIDPVLEDMHTGTAHRGKVPETALRRQSAASRRRDLKNALNRAIEEEAYEEAAKLRDQIRELDEGVSIPENSPQP